MRFRDCRLAIGIISMLVCIALAGSSLAQQGAQPGGAGAQQNPGQTSAIPDAPSSSASEVGKEKGRRIDDDVSPREHDNRVGLPLIRNLVQDQVSIWTSPARVRFNDSNWLVPLGGITAGLLVTDRQVSQHLWDSTNVINRSNSFSNYGVAALGGASVGLYGIGLMTHDEHQRESGFLSAEAAADALAVGTVFKYATGRERPAVANGAGRFWSGGDSFPSDHALAAWSLASVLAHEYPGTASQVLLYGLASAISASRVTAKQHFPSDVLVGSAIGWLIGHEVYAKHHNPELGGTGWNPFQRSAGGEDSRQPEAMGSPYVPLDSWIYPALERLIALGYASDEFLNLRPWTRLECARLVGEASDAVLADSPPDAYELVQALNREFAVEKDLFGGGANRSAQIESVYTRATAISGQPLTDGYHFGQTIINDFGRPYQKGFNNVTGVSGWASAGRWAIYIRGEYQHAPQGVGLPDAARQAIATADFQADLLPPQFPVVPGTPAPSVDRFRPLDAYVAFNLQNWQLSFGRQSNWWGLGSSDGPMMFSDNAEPVTMFKISRVTPIRLPWIMGSVRMDFFLGQLSGHEFVFGPTGLIGQYGQSLHPQPMIDGGKVSFNPTSNFEFGLSFTRIFAGPGVPFDLHTLLKSVSNSNGPPGSPADAGDGRSGFDLSYRLPWLRNWLTFYADGFTEDQISPIAYADRSAWRSGLYMPRLPHLHRMDLRVEGVYTDLPIGGLVGKGFFYWNLRYINGYANQGSLMGSWIGRQGQGAQVQSTYWVSSRTTIQTNYRHQKVSHEFIPGGGTLTDFSLGANWQRSSRFALLGNVQYEKWNFPVLADVARTNISTSVGFTFWPMVGQK